MITVQPRIAVEDRQLLDKLLFVAHSNLDPVEALGFMTNAVCLVQMGPPVVWQRARSTADQVHHIDGKQYRQRGHRFTSTKHRVGERNLAVTLAESVRERPWYGNVAIAIVAFMPDRRACDIDNIEKLILDAGTKAEIWQDDRQVTRKITLVELDPLQPRTLIGLCPTTSTLDRTIPVKDRRRPALPLQQIHIAGK